MSDEGYFFPVSEAAASVGRTAELQLFLPAEAMCPLEGVESQGEVCIRKGRSE